MKPKYEYEIRVEGHGRGRGHGNSNLGFAPKYTSAKPLADSLAEFDYPDEDFEGFITIKRTKVGK